MTVTEAFQQIESELLGIAVPVALKKQIAEPIEGVIVKLKGLQDAVERLSQQDAEEKENLRRLNQELAEKAFGKEPKTEEG
ncbi:MAG: hypothetical protein IIZ93_07345 [Acidaminococcaceae bacterium]|nr:hypothetical protein [Acidaminococcaceae bacterium]